MKESKEIHIVFQVLNFLRSDQSVTYNLLPLDKLLLIFLASHFGHLGIFPSQQTLAKELHVSLRYIKERLKILEKINLISIIKIKRKNHYELIFLSKIGEPQITYLNNEPSKNPEIGEPQITSQVNYRSPHRGTTAATNINNNNPVNKSERSRKKRGDPIPNNFQPSDQCIEFAETHNLNILVFDKFKAYHLAHNTRCHDWNYKLMYWLADEAKKIEEVKNGTH